MAGSARTQLNSAEYFERAKKLTQKFMEKPRVPPFLEFDGSIRDGVNYKVLEGVRNPVNWSEAVRAANRKPRVYLDVRVNQSGNLEARWASGPLKIYYRSDFNLLFGMGTEEWSSSSGRSRGELMYVPRFNDLVGGYHGYAALHKALLHAYAKRLDELIETLKEAVDLVGYDRVELGRQGGYSIVPSMTDKALIAAMKETWETSFCRAGL